MAHAPNLLPLKLLVISLGVLLIGGFVFLVATLTGKVNDMTPADCADAELQLPLRGSITGIHPQGAQLQVTLSDPPVSRVLTIDRCRGSVLQTLTLTPQP